MSGIAAEFTDETALVEAALRLRHEGFALLEAYTPYPVERLETAIPRPMNALPIIVFAGGFLGLVLGFGMQWYGAAVSFPVNIGGRPLASWPAFLPIAFEIMVLCAVLAGFVGFLVLARLPQLYQPVAAIAGFERVTQDRFFLTIDATDRHFDATRIRALLTDLNTCNIVDWQ